MEWKIGNVTIKNQVVLAPMAGICNSAFRRICKEMGCGLVYAEMVSDKAITYQNKKTLDMLYMTDEERKLWKILRAHRFYGYKFKRQVLIGNYIVDFLCPEKNLIIEIDGGQHNETINLANDKKRSKYLNSKGYKIIRFWNTEIQKNIESVCMVIKEYLEA